MLEGYKHGDSLSFAVFDEDKNQDDELLGRTGQEHARDTSGQTSAGENTRHTHKRGGGTAPNISHTGARVSPCMRTSAVPLTTSGAANAQEFPSGPPHSGSHLHKKMFEDVTDMDHAVLVRCVFLDILASGLPSW